MGHTVLSAISLPRQCSITGNLQLCSAMATVLPLSLDFLGILQTSRLRRGMCVLSTCCIRSAAGVVACHPA